MEDGVPAKKPNWLHLHVLFKCWYLQVVGCHILWHWGKGTYCPFEAKMLQKVKSSLINSC